MIPDDIVSPDDTILKVVHRSWVSVVPLIIALLLISAAAVVGFYLLGRYGDLPGLATRAQAITALGALLLLGLILAYAAYVIYSQNVLVLTNNNVYLITQNSLASRKISQCGIRQIEDVTASQNGILQTTLNYGVVMIETAATAENFIFYFAPDPDEVTENILTCRREAMAGATSEPLPKPT